MVLRVREGPADVRGSQTPGVPDQPSAEPLKGLPVVPHLVVASSGEQIRTDGADSGGQ